MLVVTLNRIEEFKGFRGFGRLFGEFTGFGEFGRFRISLAIIIKALLVAVFGFNLLELKYFHPVTVTLAMMRVRSRKCGL